MKEGKNKSLFGEITKFVKDIYVEEVKKELKEEGIEVIDSNFEKNKNKKYMYICIVKLSLKSIVKAFSDHDYIISDEQGKKIYQLKGNNVYKGSRSIGHYDIPLFSFGNPLNFEHDVTKCTVFLGKKKLCKLKRYKSMGDVFFETSDDTIGININMSKKILVIKNNNKKIASITQKFFLESKESKYVIEYDNESDEKIIALVFLGLLYIGFSFEDEN